MAGSYATKSVLGELAKRVPNNQRKQFRNLLELNKEYKKRLNKYPEKLPKIDWDYYRTNVRKEAVKMVDEFEKKYEELNKVFDDRVKLDTKKYYVELEKQRALVQAQIKQYIVESSERVKAYEAEILRLCTMKPYSSMTMEEFINLRPECSNYIPHQRKPLFWPHDPEEQTPGPAGIMIPGGGGGGKGGAGGKGGKQPIKPGDMEHTEIKEVEPFKDIQVAGATGTEPRKKLHPCDLVKQTQQPTTKGDVTCAATSKAPYKDEVKRKCKFVNPCKVGFGGMDSTKVEPAIEKAPPKVEPKPQSVESKKTQPADIIKKKPAPDKDPRKSATIVQKKTDPKEEICKGATTKGQSKDAKGKCVFVDPCNVGFSGKVTTKVEPTVANAVPKVEPKPQPMAPKTTHPCEVIKKKPDSDRDTCKSTKSETEEKCACKPKAEKVAAKAQPKPQPMESKKTQPCEVVKKKTDPVKDTCKSAKSKTADAKLEKTTTLQPVRSKDVEKSQTCDDVKKPKAETDMIKDKNSCTMVFADPKGAKSDPCKEDKNKQNKPCGTLPYYNPFCSEVENRKNEEKMCEDSENDDPCASDKIEEDYYNPCKDDKDKE